MTEDKNEQAAEVLDDNNPEGISRHPLYSPLLVVYWIFGSAVTLKLIGALVGFWEYPEWWLYSAAYAPAVIFFFYSLLEDVIEDAVFKGTKRALIEMLDHMDVAFPTEEDEEKIAKLYNIEPVGRA